VEHRNHDAVRGHGAAGGEDDGQNRGDKYQRENRNPANTVAFAIDCSRVAQAR